VIPEGFAARPARLEDAAEATAVVNAANRGAVGDAIDEETERDTVEGLLHAFWGDVLTGGSGG